MKPAQKNLSIKEYVYQLGVAARTAATSLSRCDVGTKNDALLAVAHSIEQSASVIIEANQRDLDGAGKEGLDEALLDRLELSEARIAAMAQGIREIVVLPDPVGEVTDLVYRPSGIQVGRMRVPLGVIGIIYESRPNVTADAAGLCLKSGNAVILRGGSEAIYSNLAIAECIRSGVTSAGLPETCVQVIDVTDRAAVGEMLRLEEFIDIIVPRGGKGLIERISKESKIPVIKHLDGVCHVYIDSDADPEKAVSIAYNAKAQRYGVCNTMETLLISEQIVDKIMPRLLELFNEAGVELRGCENMRKFYPQLLAASEADWGAEYLAPILAIRLVSGLDMAMEHIDRYGSKHTDAIVSENFARSRRFLTEVDSSSVMVNASTRFADGFEYGLGAEIGISTDKIHARGPVGLEGLTSQKFIVLGDGHIRK